MGTVVCSAIAIGVGYASSTCSMPGFAFGSPKDP